MDFRIADTFPNNLASLPGDAVYGADPGGCGRAGFVFV
jgi:hypothetical protein